MVYQDRRPSSHLNDRTRDAKYAENEKRGGMAGLPPRSLFLPGGYNRLGERVAQALCDLSGLGTRLRPRLLGTVVPAAQRPTRDEIVGSRPKSTNEPKATKIWVR